LKVIHAPKTPQKRVFSTTLKINFPYSNFHKIAIGTSHKPNKHPQVKDYLLKGKKILKKNPEKKS
jgi:hypothetical protein